MTFDINPCPDLESFIVTGDCLTIDYYHCLVKFISILTLYKENDNINNNDNLTIQYVSFKIRF